jgi:hypothetical protein
VDIPIKLKSSEKAAIDRLNQKAPELYQEKNPGFRWAASEAARRTGINWEEISRIRLEDEITSEDFMDDDKSISHLTIDDQAYEKLKAEMDQQLGMARGVQKAFLARAVIKWGLTELERESRLTGYYKRAYPGKQDLSNADVLKLCVDLFCDSGDEDTDKAEAREQIRKLLAEYQRKAEGR